MVKVKRRTKRDSAGHIYAVCHFWGNCPRDVKNKFEHKTVADKILQYGSAGVYLGGAGISTGERPINVPSVRAPVRAVPRVPVETGGLRVPSLAPAGGTSVHISDVVAEAPSQDFSAVRGDLHKMALSVLQHPTEPSVTVVEPTRPPNTFAPVAGSAPGSGQSGIELQVFPGRDAPELIALGPHGPAMQKSIPQVTSTSLYGNPAFEVQTSTADIVGETSIPEEVHVTGHAVGGIHVTAAEVLGGAGGVHPLEPLDIELMEMERGLGPSDSAIMRETEFIRTSTPVRNPVDIAPSRPPGRLPKDSIWTRLFGRRVQQIPVMEDVFLDRPQELVQYLNPAFEESVTMVFERGLESLATAAPHPDFEDVVSLSAPVTTRTAGGRIRLSRLGQRGTIRTRSGATIGPQTHYYRELSTIMPEEAIEMRSFGEHTGDATVIQGYAETALANYPMPGDIGGPDMIPEEHAPEDDMVSIDLSIPSQGTVHDNAQVPAVAWRLPEDVPVVMANIDGATDVISPIVFGKDIVPAALPVPQPAFLLASGSTYYLHPSLLRRKRKRIYI